MIEGSLWFLFAGTFVIWAGLFGYLFYLGRKNQELRREVADLYQLLRDREREETS